jgi:hypothetical protein
MLEMKITGKPCSGKSHARFDEGFRLQILYNLNLLYLYKFNNAESSAE